MYSLDDQDFNQNNRSLSSNSHPSIRFITHHHHHHQHLQDLELESKTFSIQRAQLIQFKPTSAKRFQLKDRFKPFSNQPLSNPIQSSSNLSQLQHLQQTLLVDDEYKSNQPFFDFNPSSNPISTETFNNRIHSSKHDIQRHSSPSTSSTFKNSPTDLRFKNDHHPLLGFQNPQPKLISLKTAQEIDRIRRLRFMINTTSKNLKSQSSHHPSNLQSSNLHHHHHRFQSIQLKQKFINSTSKKNLF